MQFVVNLFNVWNDAREEDEWKKKLKKDTQQTKCTQTKQTGILKLRNLIKSQHSVRTSV